LRRELWWSVTLLDSGLFLLEFAEFLLTLTEVFETLLVGAFIEVDDAFGVRQGLDASGF